MAKSIFDILHGARKPQAQAPKPIAPQATVAPERTQPAPPVMAAPSIGPMPGTPTLSPLRLLIEWLDEWTEPATGDAMTPTSILHTHYSAYAHRRNSDPVSLALFGQILSTDNVGKFRKTLSNWRLLRLKPTRSQLQAQAKQVERDEVKAERTREKLKGFLNG